MVSSNQQCEILIEYQQRSLSLESSWVTLEKFFVCAESDKSHLSLTKYHMKTRWWYIYRLQSVVAQNLRARLI